MSLWSRLQRWRQWRILSQLNSCQDQLKIVPTKSKKNYQKPKHLNFGKSKKKTNARQKYCTKSWKLLQSWKACSDTKIFWGILPFIKRWWYQGNFDVEEDKVIWIVWYVGRINIYWNDQDTYQYAKLQINDSIIGGNWVLHL